VELRGIKISQFSDFGLFSPYKTPKNVPSGDQPRDYIAEWFRFFHVVAEYPRGVFWQRVFLQLLVGGCGPQTCQIIAYGKWLYPYRMLLNGMSDLDQRCLKMCSSKDGCTFITNIFAPTPKIPIMGKFQCKTYYRPIDHKSHVNGAMKLKLYSYNGIGKWTSRGYRVP